MGAEQARRQARCTIGRFIPCAEHGDLPAAHGQAARDGAASQPRADDQCCARLSDSFVFPSTALARLPARCVVRQWRLVAICEGKASSLQCLLQWR